ncbi:TonB family protein [Nitratireductor indicus C115]|uniref:TonB family protein n=1 Tax=Nitratireductor indicus C115 TaxID=1231190 RepID=K2N7L4_9HYPH|nr:energy transducer TonB [Nitratireductor indicus]EKF43468.1 TonB family protein [Nitratireductor indicus C115]SFQ07017.1 protein TonB [Nitratireductor indicus]
MIVWPDLARSMPAEAEPVLAPIEAGGRFPVPPIRDTAEDGASGAAPDIPSPANAARLPPPAGKLLTAGLVATLLVSVLAHGAVLALLRDMLPVEGMEAASNAVSVEIILEAPPEPPAQPIAGSKEQPEEQLAQTRPPETVEPQDEKSTEPEQESKNSDLPKDPESPSEDTGETAEAEESRPIPMDRPAEEPVALPLSTEAPLPTPRPAPPPAENQPRIAPKVAAPRKIAKPAPAQKASPRPARPKPAAKAEARPAPRSSSGNTGRKGGATKGEQAAYARRLLGHVQRHKKYPAAAQNQRLSGRAGLSITIDRSGRLIDAKLRKATGHAILDKEALATARRAAPYPRPPEGVGGKTISISVNLDYKR